LFVLGLLTVSPAVQGWSPVALQAWSTIFLAMVLQAVPFLVFGVLLSAGLGFVLTDKVLDRVLARPVAAGVPVAGLAGLALPGCECAAVPVTENLIRRGVPAPVALTFMLSAPAINPTVIVSTAIAFQASLQMVPARIGASFLVAIIVGWVVAWRKGPLAVEHLLGTRRDHDNAHLLETVRHDFLHAVGFLILGAGVAASVSTFLPRSVMDAATSSLLVEVLFLAAIAFLVAACSESDAFLAASFTAFSPTAQLTFLVVGPAMDVKLASMEAGQLGTAFAMRFVPLVIGTAVVVSVLVGWVIL
jgi:uncharacterized membrane protein YraQ (UPF0718 family)